MTHATAHAGVNIALVKYWGKRDAKLNLPAVGSISMTLADLGTRTTVRFDPALGADRFVLDGEVRTDARVFQTLDAVRAISGGADRALVTSENSVPTASGLASSASGAAALGLATWAAAGLPTEGFAEDPRALDLVRRGSGSAPRSLLGGFVALDLEMGAVSQLAPPEAWDLRMVIAVLTLKPKKTSSRVGMAHTAQTSPYYGPWIASHPADLAEARAAIAARDLQMLGEVMEHSTMKMHACMLAARPPLRYWRAATLAAADVVEGLRGRGVGAWYTMDAGPHLKVLCSATDAPKVEAALSEVPGVARVHVARPGPGAWLE